MCLYSNVQKIMKKATIYGVDFDQYFYVSIDFVLNTQIENIGQNQTPKLTYFHEILHTTKFFFTTV